MRTVTLKISVSGTLLLAHPGAKPGPTCLIYAINNVPTDVPAAQVARQVSSVCLLHPHDDIAGWSYDWAELAHLQQGAIINRYRLAARSRRACCTPRPRRLLLPQSLADREPRP